MHLETGPHSILYNSPLVCSSTAQAGAEQRPGSTNTAKPLWMTKQQTSVNSACYVASHLAFRKTKLCALEGSGGSGFALAAVLTSTSPPLKLLSRCSLNLVKILLRPWARHVPLLTVETSKTRLCQAKARLWLLSVAVSQMAGSTLAICSRADPCSQLEHSWLLSSGIKSIRWEGARTGSLKQQQDEPKGWQHPGKQ